jgi:hypothetical protein
MENMAALAPKLFVQKEMLRSLNEWGIRQSKKDTGHAQFSSRAIESARKQSKQKGSKNDPLLRRIEELKETALPLDCTEAICHVLEQELQTSENKEYCIAEDKLVGLNYAPFFQYLNKFGQVCYKPKHEFQNFKFAKLDPLNRFQKKVFSSPKEWFNYRWNARKNVLSTAPYSKPLWPTILYFQWPVATANIEILSVGMEAMPVYRPGPTWFASGASRPTRSSPKHPKRP